MGVEVDKVWNDRWKPRWYRKDGVARYCAIHGCGRNCTRAEYDAAVLLAERTAKKLGPGWRPVVWENLGWHAKAVSACGRMKVHPSRDHEGKTSYTAFLGDVDSPGGKWAQHATTARAAVMKVLRAAHDEINQLQSLVTGFNEGD